MKIRKEKKQKIIQKINKTIILIILIILALYNFLFVVEKAIYKADIITIFSVRIYINPKSQQSMKPVIKTNSLLVVTKYRDKEPVIGDIVAYYEKGDFKIRRIAGINKDHTYIIKGDNNYYNEQKSLNKNEIVGRVYINIPYLGFVFRILESWITMLVIVFFCIMLLRRSFYLKKKSKRRRELKNNVP